jgi:DNA-binding MurR/RpiR family transcriptional regulator
MPLPEPRDPATGAVLPDLSQARKVLETEAAAILALVPRLDARFGRAVELLRDCRGRVIVTGIGKSGIIAQKVAATLSSTGTAAFFLHPAERCTGIWVSSRAAMSSSHCPIAARPTRYFVCSKPSVALVRRSWR